MAVIAMAEAGHVLNAPDTYMNKIAVGGGLPDDLVDLDEDPATNLKNLAKAKKVDVSDLVACIIDRPRHSEIIAKVRSAGARIMLIGDGDVSGVMATSSKESGVRSEEHTSALQSLMRNSYAVFCLKKKNKNS